MKPAQTRWALGVVPLALVCLIAARRAAPGAKLEIDPKTSISWWQVNPHLNHLWATTCPEEPSWLPGEGRSAGTGWSVDATDIKLPPGNSDADTIHIPLFPRYKVRPVCTEAVHGELVAPDTVTWRGAHGKVEIASAALITGEKLRDGFARGVVLEADKYPQIIYTIDSVVDVRHGGRDTTHALAIGSLFLHGTTKALNIPIVEWHDVGGTIRVRGRWFMTGNELWSHYGISKSALGLGVGMGIWKQLWMGVDLVMHPEPLNP